MKSSPEIIQSKLSLKSKLVIPPCFVEFQNMFIIICLLSKLSPKNISASIMPHIYG